MNMPMDVGHDLPEIYGVREIDLPEIALWEVGSQHYIVAKVTVTNKSTDQPEVGRSFIQGSLKIKSIRALSTETKTIREYENEEFSRAKGEFLQAGQQA